MVTQMPPMYGQQSMANRFAPTMPWNYGYGVSGGLPAQDPGQMLAVPPPPPAMRTPLGGGRFALPPMLAPTTPMGTAAVITESSDALLQRAAENRQRAENKRIARSHAKAAKVGAWQQAGTALGGLVGTGVGLATGGVFTPLTAAGGAALGGQIGRAAAGGDIGFGTVLPGAASTVSTLPRVKRDYRDATRQAAVDSYVAQMPSDRYGAYVSMPPTVADQFNQGNFKMFEEVWVPMYDSQHTGDFPVGDTAPSGSVTT